MATVSEARSVQDFDQVDLRGSGHILLEQSDQEALVVEADAALLPHIQSQVHDRCLILDNRRWLSGFWPAHGPIRYLLTMKQVNGATISGSGTLEARHIQTSQCELRVTGSGRMGIDCLEAQSLEVAVSGSGELDLGGKVERQDIRISGSGDLKALELDSREAAVKVSGSGRVSVQVQQDLQVSISGCGKVKYLGRPAVSQRISGSGWVERIDRT